uniref:Ig-like domain-containing protein n=1 Tax=Periophthalmus magnuspinnatus TaxID=409849 RepID=A0A3B3Z8J4_9GOBI
HALTEGNNFSCGMSNLSPHVFLRLCFSLGDNVVLVMPSAPVTLTAVGHTQRSCDAGQDIDLTCEVSDPKEPVSWFKDGAPVSEGAALKTLSDGSKRHLSIVTAAPGHSGIYSCHTSSQSVQFHVEVKGEDFGAN